MMSAESCKNSGNFLKLMLEVHFTYHHFKEHFDIFLDLAVEMPAAIFNNISDNNEPITDITVSML